MSAPGILQGTGDGVGQAEAPVDLLQQQHAAIGGDVAAIEAGFHYAQALRFKSADVVAWAACEDTW